MDILKRKACFWPAWPVALAALILMSVWVLAEAKAATSAENKKGLLALGDSAPDFRLQDVVTGREIKRDDFKEKKALLVVILCRHCPFVRHVKAGVAQLARDYKDKDLAIVAISANDPKGYPEDAPEKLKEMAIEAGFAFPLLFDETQAVARKYTAVATPDFFLFDQERKLVYRGQFDDSRPKSGIPVTGKDVRAAIDAVLSGQPVSKDQRPAVGCSIKWKSGQTPNYR
jgi:peroxiredoxin